MVFIRDEKRPQCPMGIYEAALQSVDEREHNDYGKYLLLIFAVDVTQDNNSTQFEVSHACSLSLSANSKLRKAINGLLGRDMTQDEAKAGIDVEKLIGSSCNVLVSSVEGKDGDTYSRVESVLPS